MNQTLRVSLSSLAGCLTAGFGISALLISPALAQVNGPGPSPTSTFDIVLNLPGDEAVITGGIRQGIGGVAGQTTQLNVSDGGIVGAFFVARSGGEMNISGGSVGSGFQAGVGSEVNISGGTFFSFETFSGSEVTIDGGTFGNRFEADSGGDVEFIGGEFRLNGVGFTGGTISLGHRDVFTGTLADGSSFIFGQESFDDLEDVTLTVSPLPPIDLNPIVINTPVVSGPSGLRAGQTLTLQTGGSLGNNFAVVDAELNVEAGVTGSVEASNSLVNISGGTVGASFNAYDGSVVNISGGTVGVFFEANNGSVLNVTGGDVGGNFEAGYGSEVNISDGTFGPNFVAAAGSVVNIDDGTFGGGFQGSGLLSINDGIFGEGFSFGGFNGVANISGGTFGDFSFFDGGSNADVNISGGTFGSFFTIHGGQANISGGTIGDNAQFERGSVTNISGGAIGQNATVESESVMNISGGTIGDGFEAENGTVINLFGSEFFIDGEALDNLQIDQAFTIADPSGGFAAVGNVISGVLADGEPFNFDLDSFGVSSNNFFFPNGTLTVTLTVPCLLGDCDQNGVVNFSDIPAFIEILQSGSFLKQADCNEDDVVNFGDIPSLIAILMSI